MIGGLRAFTSIAGNLSAGQRLAPTLTDISNATDADIGDVGKTAGQVFQSVATRTDTSTAEGMNKALKETESIMLAMAGQAKVGSIEFKDLSQNMGKLMSATAGFKGDVADLATTMGAVSQIAIAGGASSPEEAMTSIMRFRDDLVANQKRFKTIAAHGGVNVFADKGQTELRAPEQILFDMLKATKGNLPKVSKLFGARAAKAVQPFQAAYTKAGGGEQGMAAVQRILDNVRNAKMGKGELQESARFRVGQADRQFDQAMEKFNDAMGRELLPTVTKLVPEFVKLIPSLTKAAQGFTKFVDVLTDKPISTIGALIGAKLVADLAAASIGTKVRGALVSMLTSSRVPLPGGGGVVPIGGAGGAAAGAAARKGIVGKGIGLVGGLAAAALPAAAIAAGGHLAVGALDEQLGLKKHGLSKALAGRTEDGGWSVGQFLSDSFNPINFVQKAGNAVGMAGVEAGVFKSPEAMQKGAGDAGAKQADAATKLIAAANKIDSAAGKLDSAAGKTGANRGPNPSPVTG